jgi:hypothetical protein
MKSFKKFREYLKEEHKEVWRANVIVTDKEGKEHTFPIESRENIRSQAHKTVQELTSKGYKLKDVKYEM